jgi:hypothetical protein
MMNRFDKNTVLFWKKMKEGAGVKIVYVRGRAGIPLVVVPDDVSQQAATTLACVKYFKEVRTYAIVADDLPFFPEVGDVILDGTRRYEIFAGTGEPVFEYTDPSGIAYTVNAFSRNGDDE